MKRVLISATLVLVAVASAYHIRDYEPGSQGYYVHLRLEIEEAEAEGQGNAEEQIMSLLAAADELNEEAALLEAANPELQERNAVVEKEVAFLKRLVGQDQGFIKPYTMAKYNNNLIKLNNRNPRLVTKIHYAIINPPNEYARYYTLKAFRSGQPDVALWERMKRQEQGLTGGRVKFGGELEPRFVSGGENLYDIVMYIRSWGKRYEQGLYKLVLMDSWGCTASEVTEVIDTVFPDIE